jgi:predicted nicotinamide N-methyase
MVSVLESAPIYCIFWVNLQVDFSLIIHVFIKLCASKETPIFTGAVMVNGGLIAKWYFLMAINFMLRYNHLTETNKVVYFYDQIYEKLKMKPYDDDIPDRIFPLQPVRGIEDLFIHQLPLEPKQLSLEDQAIQAELHDHDIMCWSAYMGGISMCHWLMEHPGEVSGKRVVDLGSGSGIVAITAARMGACEVVALDNHRVAIDAITKNSRANNVAQIIRPQLGSACDFCFDGFDVITAAEIFYRNTDSFLHELLLTEARKGKTVFASSQVARELLQFQDHAIRPKRKYPFHGLLVKLPCNSI